MPGSLWRQLGEVSTKGFKPHFSVWRDEERRVRFDLKHPNFQFGVWGLGLELGLGLGLGLDYGEDVLKKASGWWRWRWRGEEWVGMGLGNGVITRI